MHRFETIDLGDRRGDTYFLVGFVEPEPLGTFDPDEDAAAYGVAVARSVDRPLADNVEIVRMDTAHGRPHLDKCYLPVDADEPRKVWLDDGYTYDRMKRYLIANWQRFVDLAAEYD